MTKKKAEVAPDAGLSPVSGAFYRVPTAGGYPLGAYCVLHWSRPLPVRVLIEPGEKPRIGQVVWNG